MYGFDRALAQARNQMPKNNIGPYGPGMFVFEDNLYYIDNGAKAPPWNPINREILKQASKK